MVLDMLGFEMRWRLPEPIRWLDYLHAHWDETRADDLLPLSDELFLGDFVEAMPHLLLAYHDVDGDCFRVEFAGEAARAALAQCPGSAPVKSDFMAGDLVGSRPELGATGAASAWLGAGYAAARRLVLPGAIHVRHGDLLALHLPYGDDEGNVRVILSGIARWPAEASSSADTPGGNVVPFIPRNREDSDAPSRPVPPRTGHR